MKYLFIACSVIFLSANANAQLTKKTWLVGGSGSYYNYTEDYSTPTYYQTGKFTSIDINASVGYFIIPKLVAGLRPGFSSFKGKVISSINGPGGGSTNSYNLSVGPFVRYYFLKADKQFNLLADVSYQIGIHKFLGALNEKGKNNTFSMMGGTEIFFNQTAGIEVLFGYTQKTVSIENSPGAATNNKKGFLASIGFNLHLQKF